MSETRDPTTDTPDDLEVARLAANFRDFTTTALALARKAEAGENPADHRAAAEAALVAGRPALARRLWYFLVGVVAVGVAVGRAMTGKLK